MEKKKMERIRLTQISKAEMGRRQMNAIRGGRGTCCCYVDGSCWTTCHVDDYQELMINGYYDFHSEKEPIEFYDSNAGFLKGIDDYCW